MLRLNFRLINSSSSDEESSNKKQKTGKQEKGNPALERLNALLKQMIEEDVPIKSEKPIELAHPKRKHQVGKKATKAKIEQETNVEQTYMQQSVADKNLESAVKKVAETIGGNAKQTESELLQKLLGTVKGQKAENASTKLSDVIKGMKIDRESKAPEQVSRAHQVRQLLATIQPSQRAREAGTKGRLPIKRNTRVVEPVKYEKVDLFGAQPLGIFTSENYVEQSMNKTWNKLQKRELRLATVQPPANYFQQMILWTEQGKIWKFPVDNEQDMIERNVPFTEHIFLEKHLEPWCPPKGPIRHFMELVCTGLSKNPYLSVEKKKEHILWFKNYFLEKEQLLKEVAAIPAEFNFDESSTTQNDSQK